MLSLRRTESVVGHHGAVEDVLRVHGAVGLFTRARDCTVRKWSEQHEPLYALTASNALIADCIVDSRNGTDWVSVTSAGWIYNFVVRDNARCDRKVPNELAARAIPPDVKLFRPTHASETRPAVCMVNSHSPDGHFMISHTNGSLSRWDKARFMSVTEHKGLLAPALCGDFHAMTNSFVFGDGASNLIWCSLNAEKPVQVFGPDGDRPRSYIKHLVTYNDYQGITCSSDKFIRLWDWRKPEKPWAEHYHPAQILQCKAGVSKIALLTRDCELLSIDLSQITTTFFDFSKEHLASGEPMSARDLFMEFDVRRLPYQPTAISSPDYDDAVVFADPQFNLHEYSFRRPKPVTPVPDAPAKDFSLMDTKLHYATIQAGAPPVVKQFFTNHALAHDYDAKRFVKAPNYFEDYSVDKGAFELHLPLTEKPLLNGTTVASQWFFGDKKYHGQSDSVVNVGFTAVYALYTQLLHTKPTVNAWIQSLIDSVDWNNLWISITGPNANDFVAGYLHDLKKITSADLLLRYAMDTESLVPKITHVPEQLFDIKATYVPVHIVPGDSLAAKIKIDDNVVSMSRFMSVAALRKFLVTQLRVKQLHLRLRPPSVPAHHTVPVSKFTPLPDDSQKLIGELWTALAPKGSLIISYHIPS